MNALRQSAGETNTGRKRRRNEDAYVCEPPLFAVADGMGGAQAGELASGLAAAALRENGGGAAQDGPARVAELIQEANRRVYQRSSEDAAVSGMGTTITVALVDDGYVTFGHVGDSRAYLIRDGSLEQLTEDHSLVAELVRSGKLSPEEAEVHPQRSVITRALGTDPDVDVDTFSVETRAGDLFLICSDGLTSMVGDETILAEAERHKDDVRSVAKALIGAANRGGGEDNITVVLFEIGDDSSPPLEETARMPALDDADESAAPEDEEETLDELDHVPAIDTMVVAPGEASADRLQAAIARGREVEPAPEPEPPPGATAARSRPDRARQRFLATLIALLVVAAIVVLVIWGLRS